MPTGRNERSCDIEVTQTTKERLLERFYVFLERLNAFIPDKSPPKLG